MPVKDDDERVLEQHRREMEQYADYRNYLSFPCMSRLRMQTECDP